MIAAMAPAGDRRNGATGYTADIHKGLKKDLGPCDQLRYTSGDFTREGADMSNRRFEM